MVPLRSKTSNLLVFISARAVLAVMTEEQLSAAEHKAIGNKLFSRKPVKKE
jgi:hypothetical protein